MSLTLHFAPGSSAFAALIALEEAKAEYRTRRIALADGEQRRPEFLALNPRGQVPVLEVDGGLVRENLAVLTYIAARHPDARLLPFDEPLKLAQCYETLSWFATNLHMAVAQIWRTERFTDNDGIKPILNEFGTRAFRKALDSFESVIARRDGAWLGGRDFTVVDALVPVASRWARRLALDEAGWPEFSALAARVDARPAVIRAVARESAQEAVQP